MVIVAISTTLAVSALVGQPRVARGEWVSSLSIQAPIIVHNAPVFVGSQIREMPTNHPSGVPATGDSAGDSPTPPPPPIRTARLPNVIAQPRLLMRGIAGNAVSFFFFN
jgi:hypothetical protein